MFFVANSIEEDKQVPVFLSVLGGKVYALLRDLLAPAKLSAKSFGDLSDVITKHFEPKPVVIAERFHFHRRNQATGESIAEYVAELSRLATHCKFGEYLSEALTDRLVCGLKSENTQKQLLAETELTLAKAIDVAQSMEATDRNAQQLKGNDLRVAQVRSRHVQQRPAKAEKQEIPDNQRKPCYRCGGRSHAERKCHFKDVLCHNCVKKGHVAKVCLSGRQNHRRGGRVSQQ